MSSLMTALVKHCLECPPAAKLLAMVLADYANEEGENIFPSVKTLVWQTGMAERTVHRHLASLQERGFLEVVFGGGGTYIDSRGKRIGLTRKYRIAPHWIKANAAALGGRLGAKLAPNGTVPTDAHRVPNGPPKGAIAVAPENTGESKHKENTHRARAHSDGVCVSDVDNAINAMRCAGIRDCDPAHPRLQGLVDQGATADEFSGAAQLALSKGEGFAYALGIVAKRRRDAANDAHEGRAPTRAPKAARTVPDAWWASNDGLSLRAAELGLAQRQGELWVEFVARIWLEAGEGPWVSETNATTYRFYQELKKRRMEEAA